jgi:class 3 adenylate cyclase
MIDAPTIDVKYLRQLLLFMQPFFGAVILMSFYVWLYRRQVKDTSLIWLSASLLCASALGALNIAFAGGTYNRYIAFILSPALNILFTITVFQLLRVREFIQRRNLRVMVNYFLWGVALVSFAAATLELYGGLYGKSSVLTLGLNIDALISSITLLLLAAGLSYSFFKYGNQPLIGLTLLNFAYVIWYQFYTAAHDGNPPDNEFLVALNIISVSLLTFLFIALTLSWALSNTSRLKFINIEPVYIVVMFVDLRGSTAWARQMARDGDSEYVIKFKNKFNEWILRCASETLQDTPHPKFTGDGFMLVWERFSDAEIINRANKVVDLGCKLFESYPSWVDSNREELWKPVPPYIGVGVDFGYTKRLTSENGAYDYEGSPVNIAAKTQGLARPNGGVVIRDKWNLSGELRKKFIDNGEMVIGDEYIPIRTTNGVKLPAPTKIDLLPSDNLDIS